MALERILTLVGIAYGAFRKAGFGIVRYSRGLIYVVHDRNKLDFIDGKNRRSVI